MVRSALFALALSVCSTAAGPREPLASDAEIRAAAAAPVRSGDASYVAPYAPFNVIGDIYYVGPPGVSSFLITTPNGDFLLDAGMPQTAPLIEAHIAALGFNIHDVKVLLNSHAHYDHAGGLAQLKRDSGAILVAGASDAPILAAGQISYGPSAGVHYPPVRADRLIHDGETLTLGGVTLRAHATPGHTPGCTSWSMAVEGADGVMHEAFFHCSATVAGQRLVPPSYPGMIEDYRATFARIRSLHADVFLASHGAFFDLAGKRARQVAGDENAFVDPPGLQSYNNEMESQFNAELAREAGSAR